jgi:AcrR family transcriptional regulator
VSGHKAGPVAALPRGRHHLSRDQVERSQRLRLAVAMADACVEGGYTDTSVAAVLELAGVSRQTFYALYPNKLECFLEALDLVGEVLVGQLGTSLQDSERSPIDQAISSLDRYLDAIATHRAFARLFVVEAHAAGPRALLRRAELQAVVVDALVDLLAARDANARFACEAFVAAVSALVTLPLATGDVDALRALRNPLVGRLRALADETSR